jgi:3,4-dihydroxy 2-butanone 4-phosphate synthase/GTP cyclohydrolase II
MEENRENAVADAVKAFAEGKIVLVMDDFDRENECDMIALGETLTKQQMATMIKYTTGIICVVAEKERLEGFGLYPAAHHNTDPNGTNFYVATDYLVGTTTGVSAGDRVATVKAMCDKASRAEDFSKPGHMFPLCPRPGGVLERGGHTESAYDLCPWPGRTRSP